ncbi:hypothetical protein [Actinophytocola xanthii]|uniref:Uncharacterized protein n=1 Tax=Actinophytocola xanthii TaxID=1912961 RepID=A0A1Q8CX49_9PSEU|nr:hypothetical protein [Actinophytocola xanthii]OLF18912.1 hypothetical protein BU204_03365 [Actinophytocola xanthii]
MGWIFALNAECGRAEGDARALARHFHDWSSDVVLIAEDWWCGVVPAGLSRSGVRSAADAAAMTSAGIQLYERLRSAPPVYRYALVGVETDEFRHYDELTAQDEDVTVFPGLVISDDIWTAVGKPPVFGAFAPGYRWLPYVGEGV